MIALAGIRKRFGALQVLTDISLAVRPGAVTALVGPNASGKTTLLKIVLGLTRPDAGALLVNGEPADAAGDYRRALGYMPQAARFPDNLRVRDVLALVSALRPGTARDEELIGAFALQREMDKPVGTLSGGTRQKLNAAIAFLFRPALLILDEPTAGLDPVASGVLKEKIRRARAEGRTVVVSSHILAELEELADDVAFLCDGSLRFAGTVAALLARTGETRLEPAIAALMRSARGGALAPAADAPPAAVWLPGEPEAA
ncbi:MAG TPA: ABC transporter ATP-binding protein [Gemmatimonadaceae bacterium]|nr:ABC transporter ATP-binding protein [Gemmatimonadaceae bacterium]